MYLTRSNVAFTGKFQEAPDDPRDQEDSLREHKKDKDDSGPEHKDSEPGSDESFMIIDDQLPQLHAAMPTAYAGRPEPKPKARKCTGLRILGR